MGMEVGGRGEGMGNKFRPPWSPACFLRDPVSFKSTRPSGQSLGSGECRCEGSPKRGGPVIPGLACPASLVVRKTAPPGVALPG